MPAPPLDALLLDMDGLLIDSEPLWFEIERAFCRARGFDWTAEHAAACIGRGLQNTVAVMGQRFGFDVDPARDSAALVGGVIARVGEMRLKPGASELLAGARGRFALALASSSPRHLVHAIVDRFDLRSELRAIVTGDDVARHKPAPDIFLRAAAELGVPPARCAVLEDSLAGVTAGRAAGMTVIAVPEGPWEGRGFEAVADVCCPDLHRAAAWLGLSSAPERP
jgi:beta-phosphoglucomutase-like phosphatase (HAD superfamily)